MKSLNYFNNFFEEEEETTKKTLRQFRKEFELYERSFNLLSETMIYLYNVNEYNQERSATRTVIFSIMPRIIQSMQSIRALSLRGYYYDAAILERSLVESMGLCAYFALNEKEAENWVEGKDVKIAKIKLMEYIPALLRTNDKGVKSIYGELSDYVHTHMRAIASLIADIDHETGRISFYFTPKFDKKRMTEIAVYPTFMLLMLIETFQDELLEKREGIMRFVNHYLNEKNSTSSVNGKNNSSARFVQ